MFQSEYLSWDLFAAAWPETLVEEGSLRVHVSALRKALGDGPSNRMIESVSGRGYCFVQPVVEVTELPSTVRSSDVRPADRGALIGRHDEIELLARYVAQERLVSVVGPGGIGKTTLVGALIERLGGRFDGGACLVDLASVTDGALLPSVIGEAAGTALAAEDQTASLAEHLGDRDLLLVLDCCEHLIDAVAAVTERLAARATCLRIVTTSREPLRAQGEWVYRLGPLAFPPEGTTPKAALAMTYPAVQLFVDRAAASLRGYVLEDADCPHICAICRRLDGIALALELAAARLEDLGVQGLLASLQESFDALILGRRTALPRHRTLRGALEWSYTLLAEPQRATLAALSVFNQGFTLDAARQVVPSGPTGIDACIADLVAQSLVVVDRDATPFRYRLLDMTRSHAAKKLLASGGRDEVARRHALYYLATFKQVSPAWDTGPQPQWLVAHQRDLGNLRDALDWAFSPGGDGALGVALTIAASPLLFHFSMVDECLSRVRQACRWLENQEAVDDAQLMRLHAIMGFPRMRASSREPHGAAAWQQTLSIARRIGDVDFQLRATWALWVDRTNAGEPREALEWCDAFQELAAQSTDPADRLIARRMRARSLHLLGDQAAAEAHVRAVLEGYRTPADGSHLARFQYEQRLTARITLARVLWLRGETNAALAEVDGAVAEAQALGHNLTLSHVLSDAACPVALLAGDLERASRYTALLLRCTEDHALDVWRAYAVCFEGEILIRQGEAEAGIERLSAAVDQLERSDFWLFDTVFRAQIAAGLRALGRAEDAAALLERLLVRCERSGEAWYVPELLRQKANLLAASGRRDEAASHLKRSITMAEGQKATAWVRRATARLHELGEHI